MSTLLSFWLWLKWFWNTMMLWSTLIRQLKRPNSSGGKETELMDLFCTNKVNMSSRWIKKNKPYRCIKQLLKRLGWVVKVTVKRILSIFIRSWPISMSQRIQRFIYKLWRRSIWSFRTPMEMLIRNLSSSREILLLHSWSIKKLMNLLKSVRTFWYLYFYSGKREESLWIK